MRHLIVTCDGACRRGVGGWAYLIQELGAVSELASGAGVMHEEPTTNQRAELVAGLTAIQAARALDPDAQLTVVSDSAYLVNCFLEEWHVKWARNGWTSSKGGKVANRDLWERLVPLIGPLVSFAHVRGHSGHPANEHCDEAASGAVEDFLYARAGM